MPAPRFSIAEAEELLNALHKIRDELTALPRIATEIQKVGGGKPPAWPMVLVALAVLLAALSVWFRPPFPVTVSSGPPPAIQINIISDSDGGRSTSGQQPTSTKVDTTIVAFEGPPFTAGTHNKCDPDCAPVLDWPRIADDSVTLGEHLANSPRIAFAVLTVGSDRTPLGVSAERAYASNAGLASARADALKEQLGELPFPLIVEYRFGYRADPAEKVADRTPQLKLIEFINESQQQ